MAIILSKTKEVIFDIAVKTIAEVGYDNADMRTIAAGANIKAGSIYNHFASKQEILSLIYDYYLEHFLDNRKPVEFVKEVIRTGTTKEIVDAMCFTFENPDIKIYHRMILITKIIYMRLFQDGKATAIFQSKMTTEPELYIKDILDYAISIGRFKPFDTSIYAFLFVNCRNIMAVKAFINPNYQIGQLEEEQRLNNMLMELLV